MSATNRGADRYELDDYPTPAWCVHRLLDRVRFDGNRWYEPCAGDGSIIRAVNSHHSMAGRKIEWSANEIQPKYEAQLRRQVPLVTIADLRAVTFALPQPYDVYISNPPFSIAQEVAEIGFHVATTVILLLRINFYGSKHRHPWISNRIPAKTGVLPDRPAFRLSKTTGKLGTDATEYAWFCWQRPFKRSAGELFLLDLTDPDVLEEDRTRIRGKGRKANGKPVEEHPRYDDFVEDLKDDLRK